MKTYRSPKIEVRDNTLSGRGVVALEDIAKDEIVAIKSGHIVVATIGQAARYHATTFSTNWAGVRVSCYENGIRIEGCRDDLLLARAESVTCRQSEDTNPQTMPSTLACDVDSEVWAAIDKQTFKTYVPASAESRAGAGAGLTDND
ncbi:MAG: hypothetical protein O6649_02145 [Gammaproteobacteria bacterium]|nr:hypothetical protein [Gammaproteobacteria bacterium]MCZ6579734.1 hypothetical protein [Gammaproteobacteria bacterium]